MTSGIAGLAALHRQLGRLDQAFGGLSNLCQLSIMVVVVIDVLCRYILNSPVTWAYDVISRYLMVAVFFFALSWTHASDEHVRVLFFRQRASARACRIMDLAGSVAALVVFVLIFWLGLDRFWQDWTTGAVSVGAYLWPNWIASISVPLGAGMMILRLVLMTIAQAIGVFLNEDLLGLERTRSAH